MTPEEEALQEPDFNPLDLTRGAIRRLVLSGWNIPGGFKKVKRINELADRLASREPTKPIRVIPEDARALEKLGTGMTTLKLRAKDAN